MSSPRIPTTPSEIRIDDNKYIPSHPDIHRDICEHSSVISELNHQFGDKTEQFHRFIDLQIAILRGHKNLTCSQSIRDRCSKTIRYWERRRTNPEATWKTTYRNNDHSY